MHGVEIVADAQGVVHHVQHDPVPFITMAGGMPGLAWCGTLFYNEALGPGSCSLANIRHPYAKPMVRTEEAVNCMTCLVIKCR